jgi:hypothetical protein
MLNRTLLFAAVIPFTATVINHAPAVWRGPPQMHWVKDLKNKVGSPCCDTADGLWG